MTTQAENRETLRLAVLAALRSHFPDWKDGHVTYEPGPVSFGAATGVVDLNDVSSVCEAEHESWDAGAGQKVRTEVYREVWDVTARQAGANTKDVAARLRNAVRRHDFNEALGGSIKLLRLPSQLRPIRELDGERLLTHWTFELHLRVAVSYTTGAETPALIEHISLTFEDADEIFPEAIIAEADAP